MRARPVAGDNAITLLEWIVDTTPAIRSIDIVMCDPAASMPERVKRKAISFALTNSDGTEMWFPPAEAVLIHAAQSGLGIESLVEESAWHDESGRAMLRGAVAREELTSSRLNEIFSQRPGWMATVSSHVQCESGVRHLPLMDFQCPVDANNKAAVIAGLRAAGQFSGAILESGNSYHYYGFEPLEDNAWLRFLGKCLLLGPLTDTRYIGHRLVDRECLLRLTAHWRKPVTPTIVQML